MIYLIIEKLAVGVLGLGIVISGLLTASTKPNTSAIPNGVEKQTITEQKAPAITKEQELWLEFVLPKLLKSESGGNPFAVNWEDVKRTGEPSIGCYQYQRKTFKASIKKFNLLPYTEENEYMNFIYDCDFQKELTRLILINEKEGWLHWKNSFINLKLPKYPKSYENKN